MADQDMTQEISDEERAADGRVDAIAAISLLAIVVCTALIWISGH